MTFSVDKKGGLLILEDKVQQEQIPEMRFNTINPKYIIIYNISARSLKIIIENIKQLEKASIHFLIDREGNIVQFAKPNQQIYAKEPLGIKNKEQALEANTHSIIIGAITLASLDDNSPLVDFKYDLDPDIVAITECDDFTNEQTNSIEKLLKEIRKKYPIKTVFGPIKIFFRGVE